MGGADFTGAKTSTYTANTLRRTTQLCYFGNTTSVSFVEWFRTKFVKAIPIEKLKKLYRRHGMRLLFLPAYSPDYNPVEKS
jgi:hypothetical protein